MSATNSHFVSFTLPNRDINKYLIGGLFMSHYNSVLLWRNNFIIEIVNGFGLCPLYFMRILTFLLVFIFYVKIVVLYHLL